jgi:hypothetical protein
MGVGFWHGHSLGLSSGVRVRRFGRLSNPPFTCWRNATFIQIFASFATFCSNLRCSYSCSRTPGYHLMITVKEAWVMLLWMYFVGFVPTRVTSGGSSPR